MRLRNIKGAKEKIEKSNYIIKEPNNYKGNYQERDQVKQQASEYAGLIYHAILERDFDDLDSHINNIIMPKLSANKNKVSKKIYQKDQRIEPTF